MMMFAPKKEFDILNINLRKDNNFMTEGNEGYIALIANFKTNLIKFLPFLQKMKGWKMRSMI